MSARNQHNRSMKKALLFITAALLAACANNGHKEEETFMDCMMLPAAEMIDWEKPLFSIDDEGDTITRCLYDDQGRLSKILSDYDNKGIPGCITTYTYDGNIAHVTSSCEPGQEEIIVFEDESCTKIIEEAGQKYEYDDQGRISKITIGNRAITYKYTIDEATGLVHAEISDSYLIQQDEDRDKYGRLVYESRVNDEDIYTTTYTYEGNVCRARVENKLHVKNDFGGVPGLEDVFTDEYEYLIYY